MFQKSLMKLLLRQWKKEDIFDKMNRVEKSLLDTDILSEIIKRANPQIIAKADIYLSQFEKYTFISLSKNSRFRRFTNTK